MKNIRLFRFIISPFLLAITLVILPFVEVSAQPKASPAQKQEGVLRLDRGELATQVLDPMLSSSSTNWFLILLYDSLVGVNPYTGKLSPDYGLAENMKMTPDGLTWTFTIRKGIKFHNGDPLTAEDVAFSLDRAILGKRAVTMASSLLRPAVKEIVATGPYTVEFRLKEPRPTLDMDISLLSDVCNLIVPKNYIMKNGDDYFLKHPVGSGPYKFIEQEVGHHITLEAVDNHWRIGVPKYKRIELQLAAELSTRIAKLKTREVDAIDISRERVKEMKRDGFNVFTRGGKYWMLSYLQQWDPKQPVSDIRVRKALNLAIDKKTILDTILAGQGELIGFAPGGKTTIGYEPVEPYPYDPERAKKLLAEAGYPNGWEWTLFVSQQPGAPENVRVAEAIAAYWEKIGVKNKIQVMDWPSIRSKWNKKELVNCAHLLAASYRPTVSQYVNYVGSRSGLPTILDPEIDRLLRIAEGDFDPKKRHEAAHKVQMKMVNEHLFGPLFETGDVWATIPEIKSWNMGMIGFDINLEDLFTKR
jgi:peptide/nickel transport system substrate-binding protein